MKNCIKISILFISIFLLTGCSKDDDANDSSKYLGVFVGEVFFTDGINEISLNEAEVEVIQVADNYEIIFPNEIPNLVGLEYEDFGSYLLNIEANKDHLVRNTDITFQLYILNDECMFC